ncbi:MAG: CAP domain-containing protein [Epsilonproteobacteria bacterium]|nr:CAP domain-containing protein [Campylobacterota bacterium]
MKKRVDFIKKITPLVIIALAIAGNGCKEVSYKRAAHRMHKSTSSQSGNFIIKHIESESEKNGIWVNNDIAGEPSFEVSSNLSRAAMLQAINEIRSHPQYCGGPAPALRWNSSLEAASKEHSKDMAINNFLSHQGSNTNWDITAKALRISRGSYFYERAQYHGYRPKMVGETVARVNIRGRGSWPHALKVLMRSPKHCKVIMNPKFTEVGMAEGVTINGKTYWTITFGRPMR